MLNLLPYFTGGGRMSAALRGKWLGCAREG
jgi:hypothetical protein